MTVLRTSCGGSGLASVVPHAWQKRVVYALGSPQLVHAAMGKCSPVGSHAVRPGDYVWITPYLVHRDERFWPEPDRFLPDRWLDPAERPRLAFIPFGAGAAKCPGDLVTWQAAGATVLTAVSSFDLCSPAGAVVPDPSRPVRRPRSGIPMRLRRRSDPDQSRKEGTR